MSEDLRMYLKRLTYEKDYTYKKTIHFKIKERLNLDNFYSVKALFLLKNLALTSSFTS